VERTSHVAYDEVFHLGVNIIRGDNSSGKSTVLNLIFYGLGGDVTDWSPTALLCTRVLVEVELNGRVATLSREIAPRSGISMEIFSGDIDRALLAPATEWARHPYRRSESTESFSQVLFRILDIPEAFNESSGNITVHQMLRLMYADQLSPVGTLFKFEQFDPPLLRDTVGRLIFGAYENEYYSNELRIKELETEHDRVASELIAIQRLLGRVGEAPTQAWLLAERSRVESAKGALENEIAAAEQQIYLSTQTEKLSLKAQQSAYAEVQSAQAKMSEVQARLDRLALEIADADAYMRDLQNTLTALQDSSAASNAFGQVSFQYCPACYSPIETEHVAHACHLCKTPYESERARTRIIKLINDTARQLKQSRQVQKGREIERAATSEQLRDIRQTWQRASERLASAVRTPTTEAREKLRSLQRQAGYIDRQLEDLAGKEKLMGMLEGLIERKALLYGSIDLLRQRNKLITVSLQNRLGVAYRAVEKEVLQLLHDDLPREDAFINAKTVQFDFAANKLGVDNEIYFSASSRVILRNSFFLGLFAAATKDSAFRHFRLCLLDTIEDKGMQDERSHNFQRLIVRVSQLATSEHQIIFGTSMIAPDLDVSTLTVGHYSTREHRTLRIASKEMHSD
jgi:hypothetical protein